MLDVCHSYKDVLNDIAGARLFNETKSSNVDINIDSELHYNAHFLYKYISTKIHGSKTTQEGSSLPMLSRIVVNSRNLMLN